MIAIKHRFINTTLCEFDVKTIKEAVVKAVESGAEKVFVLEGEGLSKHDNKTKYAPETWVIPDSFNEDRREECSNGIHFFITRIEAENY